VSFWKEISGWLGVGCEHKPTLKRGIYSLCFGMGRAKLRRTLRDGKPGEPGLGKMKAELWFRHPLIQELLEARERITREIEMDGFANDAFGREIQVSRSNPPHKVAAQIAQSYEMRILKAVLPVVKEERKITIVSWLHDGCSLWFGAEDRKAAQIERIKQAVKDKASKLGIQTTAEIS
jgi:hypothetical protein